MSEKHTTQNVDTSLDCFQKIPKHQKKWEKHSIAEHTPNPSAYEYVDDFRTYFERIKFSKDI